MNKKFRLFTAGIIVALATVTTLSMFSRPVAAAGIDTTRDCDNTAIIHCGVMTLTELKTKYAANEPGDLPAVYKAFNITNFDGFVDGAVMRDGTVVVNGKVIATGAMTAARNMPGGDIAGSQAKIISPSVWPAEFISGKPAYIKVVNGQFAYAILKTCGNPVKATPVVPPKPPVAACVKVTPIKVDRDRYDFKGEASAANGAKITSYVFTITHSSGSAKVVTVTTGATSATSGAVQLEDGTHTVKLTVNTSLGAKTSAACTAEVTVPPVPVNKVEVCNPANGQIIEVDESQAGNYKPKGDVACSDVRVCNPETGVIMTVKKSEESKYKPEGDAACGDVTVCNPATGNTMIVKKAEESKYKPEGDAACQHVEAATTTLPSTGPTDLLMGGAGVSSLTAAGYYWRASRRRVLSSLLNR